MCGICGYTGPSTGDTLASMVGSLTHRGPDDRGTFSGPDVQLGIARLAIIDRAGGHQPMTNEDGTVHIVFNGEIFNYIELRAELESLGHQFSTRSDSETIVHAYEEYGAAFGHKLNGMFAIAIWDSRTKTASLVRDRYGEKPLFYAITDGTLVFGSEIKAVLRHPGVSRELDPEGLSHFFGLRNIPAPFTAFRDIRSLPAGHLLEWRDGAAHVSRWYRLPMAPRWDEADEETLVSRIDGLLRDSVRLRLQSEVAFGAYLSGGIDSSMIVAMMSEMCPAPVKTFTLRFADDPAHKRDPHFARMVSDRYHTEHHECVMSAADLGRELGAVLQHLDQPFAGVISSYWLTRFIKPHVTVALSGDGADDLFASYGHHRLVGPITAVQAARAGGRSDADVDYGFFSDRPEFVQGLAAQAPWEWRLSYAAFPDADKDQLWSAAGREWMGRYSTSGFLKRVYESAPSGADPLNRMLYLDSQTLLPNEILYFNDMLSMAHSVEVRAPFLDWRLVELAASIPAALKIRGRSLKYILRRVAERYVPPEILNRPKEGFVLPANTWLRTALAPLLREVLADERIGAHGLWDRRAVRSLRAAFDAGDDTLTFRVWTLVAFQLWFEGQSQARGFFPQQW